MLVDYRTVPPAVLFSGDGWELPAPVLLARPRAAWEVPAEKPEALGDLLAELDRVATSGDEDLLAAGFVTYEAGVALEGSGGLFRRPAQTPLASFALYRLTEAGAPPFLEPLALAGAGPPGSSLSRAEWAAAVAAIREGIARGDVYQVNLTRRIRLPARVPPFALAAALFADNPVPLAMTFAGEGFAVISNSPELFLDVDLRAGSVSSGPIKGTVARGPDPNADEEAARRLLASEKDAAEHVMIVDLVRNDLGRVAVAGGVRVPRFRTLLTFRHLHHLESTVAARLAKGTCLSDILRATLPGGSITGAPKRASLRFIRDLEPCPRGAYTGAAGYVRGNGRAVFNVAIRTAVAVPDAVDYHAGGGIVWDSDPEAEWLETETKSREFAAVAGRRARAGVGR